MFWYLFLLMITARTVNLETPDITLLTQEDNLMSQTYCIAGANVESGLYLAGPITKNTTEYGNYLKEITLKDRNDLLMGDSSHIVFKPIVDKRWQTFPSLFTEDNKLTFSEDNVVLSVRSNGHIYIYISLFIRYTIQNDKIVKHEKYYDSKWQVHKMYGIDAVLSNENWLHIRISKYDGTIYFFDELLTIPLNINIKSIETGSAKLAEWKKHKFKYWEIKKVIKDWNEMTFALNLNNTNTCVAAYALTCDTCNLNMAIIDNDKNIIADSSISGDGKTWKKIQIDLPQINEHQTYTLHIGTEAKYENNKNNFWMFSHLHYCQKNEFRIINKSHNTNQKYYCATLNGKKVHFVQRSLSTYKCINESIGNKCQIHCEELSQYFDNVCNKSIICNAFTNGNSKCFCPVWTKEILCKDAKNVELNFERTFPINEEIVIPKTSLVDESKSKQNISDLANSSKTVIIPVFSHVSYGIITIIIISFILVFLLIVCIVWVIQKQKEKSNQHDFEIRPLIRDIPKDYTNSFDSYVKQLLKSNVQVMISKDNDYVENNGEYEQSNSLDVNINLMTYVYFSTYDKDMDSLWDIIWNKEIATVIHIKLNINDVSLVTEHLGTSTVGNYNLTLKEISKTSNFLKKYFHIFKSNNDVRDLTFYEIYWHPNQYPLDMIMLQIHLLSNISDTRSHLVYCPDKNKCYLTILCHACLRDTKERQKVSSAYMLKLLMSKKDLFDNSLVFNNIYKRLFIMLLDCFKISDTTIDIGEKFDVYTSMKIKGGLKDEMHYLNYVIWYDKTMLELSGQKVQKTLFKHELCLADRKFIMTAIPAPSNFNTYLKDIASNNVNLLITFNYRLIQKKSEDLQISLTKEKETDSYEIYSCILEFSPNFLYTADNKRVIRLINMKCPDFNRPDQFLKFCEVVNDYLWHNVKTIHVTCKDGIKMSGLYVAFMLIKYQMNFEKSCNVCSAVRQLRCLNENYFKTEKEYKYLYDLALEYTTHTNDYTYCVI